MWFATDARAGLRRLRWLAVLVPLVGACQAYLGPSARPSDQFLLACEHLHAKEWPVVTKTGLGENESVTRREGFRVWRSDGGEVLAGRLRLDAETGAPTPSRNGSRSLHEWRLHLATDAPGLQASGVFAQEVDGSGLVWPGETRLRLELRRGDAVVGAIEDDHGRADGMSVTVDGIRTDVFWRDRRREVLFWDGDTLVGYATFRYTFCVGCQEFDLYVAGQLSPERRLSVVTTFVISRALFGMVSEWGI